MKNITGKEVFEFLSKMTEDERAKCRFPGFFTDADYDQLVDEVIENADDLDDDEYDKASNVDNADIAKWTEEAILDLHQAWADYVQQVNDAVADKLLESVRK